MHIPIERMKEQECGECYGNGSTPIGVCLNCGGDGVTGQDMDTQAAISRAEQTVAFSKEHPGLLDEDQINDALALLLLKDMSLKFAAAFVEACDSEGTYFGIERSVYKDAEQWLSKKPHYPPCPSCASPLKCYQQRWCMETGHPVNAPDVLGST